MTFSFFLFFSFLFFVITYSLTISHLFHLIEKVYVPPLYEPSTPQAHMPGKGRSRGERWYRSPESKTLGRYFLSEK
ncbi:hypothetical protein DFH27DRAFT_579041 [Peziza echinospora]|nr:hypothetical protein DFH27DRAFT_579041 [Peziza echinospora]